MIRAWFKMEADLLQDEEIEALTEQHGHEAITAIVAVFSYLRTRKTAQGKIKPEAKKMSNKYLNFIILNSNSLFLFLFLRDPPLNTKYSHDNCYQY